MTHETLTSSQLSVRAAALRMVDLPLSVYSSLAQVRVFESGGSFSTSLLTVFYIYSMRGEVVEHSIALCQVLN